MEIGRDGAPFPIAAPDVLHLQREHTVLTKAHITRHVRVRARARARSHGGGERVRGDEELRLDCLGFFDRLRARIKGEG